MAVTSGNLPPPSARCHHVRPPPPRPRQCVRLQCDAPPSPRPPTPAALGVRLAGQPLRRDPRVAVDPQQQPVPPQAVHPGHGRVWHRLCVLRSV